MKMNNTAAKLSTKQTEVLTQAANHFAGRFSMVSAGKGRRWIGPTGSVLALERKGLLTRGPWNPMGGNYNGETTWSITDAGRAAVAAL